MAPIKRARPVDDTVEVLESASSNFRARNQKRPRLSVRDHNDDDDHGHAEEDDEDPDLLVGNENGEYTATQRRFGGNRENYERERDEVSDHGDDEAMVERMTQNIRQNKRSQKDNQAADAGVIESVTCTNFMCHTKLHIVLGPLINFIIGHNGSGKSAILTALTLCLGGKATATNRGQSLKSFVKEGQETASLSVKIKNRGDQGYRQDVFGDSITVERHFTIHGSSSFKIKSTNGKLISTKRSELDEITDFYALQLDNPVNVLTQDMARQFLNSSTENDKYKFFVKGVQLEQLDNDYTVMSDTLDNTDALVEVGLENLKVLSKRYDDALRKYQLSERQASLRGNIQLLSQQMAWAQVEEQEKYLANLMQEIEEAQTTIDSRRENEKTAADDYDAAVEKLAEGEASQQELAAALPPLLERQAKAKEEVDANHTETTELHTTQRQIQTELKTEQDRKTRTLGEIDQEKRRLEAADDGAHANKLAEIEEAERLVPQAQEELNQHLGTRAQLVQNSTAAAGRVEESKAKVSRKRVEVENAENQLHQLQNQVPEAYAAYHSTTRDAVEAINRERRFHRKPVGPLGEYIKILKPEWSSILETFFGGMLNNFVVIDKHDQELLSDLLKRCRSRAAVHIISGQFDNISQNEPDARYNTILRSLEFKDELVRNQLLITQHIEKVILIKDRKEAFNMMFGQNMADSNVCLCFNESARGAGIRLSRGSGGVQKSDPIKAWGRSYRMKTDVEAQISIQRNICHGLKQELNDLEAEKRRLEDEAMKCTQAIRRHDNQTKELRAASQRAEDRVAELNNELEAATPQHGKLDILKGQLANIEEILKHHHGQNEASKAEKRSLTAQGHDLLKTLTEISDEVKSANAKVKKTEDNVKKLGDKRRRALEIKNASINHRQDAERAKADLEGNRQGLAENVRDFERQASIIGKRVHVDRGETPASLDGRLSRLNDQIRQFERQIGGDAATIARNMHEAKQARDVKRQLQREAERTADALKLSLATRHFRWRQFRSNISTRARANFTYLLSERDFKGRMLIDHKSKQLQLLVQPDGTRRGGGDEGRQTRTLSGGEKSFSTICLLLALWDAMGSPIRCLDEFDVFMDSVNRDVSMKMMIQAARGSVGRQFILITPQAMGNVSTGEDVKIIRMSDPERGQTALPFVPA